MPVRIDLRYQGDHRCRHMPGDRFAAGTGKTAPLRDDLGADHDQHADHDATGDEAAEAAHESHEAITGTPEALPTSFSNCAGSVVKSPSRMVLLAPW